MNTKAISLSIVVALGFLTFDSCDQPRITESTSEPVAALLSKSSVELSMVPISETTIKLIWHPIPNSKIKYDILRRTVNDNSKLIKIGSFENNTAEFIDSTLHPANIYEYCISSNSNGLGKIISNTFKIAAIVDSMEMIVKRQIVRKPLTDVEYNNQGNLLACCGWWQRIVLLDPSNLSLIKNLDQISPRMQTLCFSGDDKYLISGGGAHDIITWDIETGKKIQTINAHDGRINSVEFHPLSHLIISSSLDRTIKLWNSRTGLLVKTYVNDAWVNECMEINNKRNLIAFNRHSEILCVDVFSGEIIKSFTTLLGSSIYDIEFSPDDKYFVSCSQDNKRVVVWDYESGSVKYILNSFSETLSMCAAFSNNGVNLFSGSYVGSINAWNMINGSHITDINCMDVAARCMDIDPNGKFLAVGSDFGTLYIFEIIYSWIEYN
ncbi:MAG: hypothetical protein V1720_17000 [bacterium]